ncbi:hypothetical protein KKC88_00660 [Patescibacteria group bacterium]|nr:hypothetical protein [Patescibacteria group bacterium]MBU1673776.1 hypothetical protein [Patescibacteria group bacterium]MBU1964116.1 hypothetical protein [Patescibacteria group bacterium]
MNQQGKTLIIVLIVVLVLVILGGVGYYAYYAGYLDGLLGRTEPEPVVVEQVSVTDEIVVPLNTNANANANANGNTNENMNANANTNAPLNTNQPAAGVVELTAVTYNDCFFLAESSATCGTKTIFFVRELGTEQLVDTDKDGIPDILEELFGTKVNAVDSDNDTYGDMEEILNGFNPAGTGEIVFEAKDGKQWVEMFKDKIESVGIILP